MMMKSKDHAVLAAAAILLPSALMAQDARTAVKQVRPAYPQLARQAHISGSVRVEVVIAPNGKVKSASVLGGHPLLAQTALEAAKQWQYAPAASESSATVVFNFNEYE